jgi:lipopolysaccharide export system ATP-binding protein
MNLEARALVVRVGRTDVVRGVDLSIAAGEVVGILGPSGAGKTTLFRALVGEIEVASGSVHFGGEDVTAAPLWKRARLGVGYVPQTPSVLVDLTVEDNLSAFERLAPKADRRGAAAWAELVELGSRRAVRAGELSGGERRRLELARALIARPSVLVCDEPFAGIDPVGAERMGDLLRDQTRRGAGVLLADHHVSEALRVCDRAALLVDGRIEVTGPPETFRSHPLVQGRYLGSWHRTVPPPPRGRTA